MQKTEVEVRDREKMGRDLSGLIGYPGKATAHQSTEDTRNIR